MHNRAPADDRGLEFQYTVIFEPLRAGGLLATVPAFSGLIIAGTTREEIPAAATEAIRERLQMPFSAYCVDCQTKLNHRPRPGEGYIDEPSRSLWTLPGEMDESLEKSDAMTGPDEQLMVRGRAAGRENPKTRDVKRHRPRSRAGFSNLRRVSRARSGHAASGKRPTWAAISARSKLDPRPI
jgi:hypothetical protein